MWGEGLYKTHKYTVYKQNIDKQNFSDFYSTPIVKEGSQELLNTSVRMIEPNSLFTTSYKREEEGI